MDFVKLAVGQPFPAKINGEVVFTMSNNLPTLILNWNGITSKETQAVRKGLPQFSVTKVKSVIFLLARFGLLEWMDVPYSVHLDHDLDLDDININDGEGLGLHIILIEARTNTVKVMRLITLDTGLSRTLIDFIKQQQNEPFDMQKYYREVNMIYSQYSTRDLLEL